MCLLPVVVRDLARGDFLEGERQRVLAGGVDHRRRELVEGALTEVVVVRVDLAGALGGHQHGGVVGIDVLKERVDRSRVAGAVAVVAGVVLVALG